MEGELIKRSKQIPPYCDNEREQESKKYKIEYKITETITKGGFATKEEIDAMAEKQLQGQFE